MPTTTTNNNNNSKTTSLEEIKTILIQNGYLRAKIKTLTDFDIIAGGLSWCIYNSYYTINVEFKENAIIKDKILISENISAALRNMKCPFELHPYQIQGLDYSKIIIIINWLIKFVVLCRHENSYSVRQYTGSVFSRLFGCGVPVVEKIIKNNDNNNKIEDFNNNNKIEDFNNNNNNNNYALHFPSHSYSGILYKFPSPKRCFIPPPLLNNNNNNNNLNNNNNIYNNRSEHAASVLLEYGFKYQFKDSKILLLHSSEYLDTKEHKELTKIDEEENIMLDNLLSKMKSYKEKQRVSAINMNKVISQCDNNKIMKLQAAYEARKEELSAKLSEENKERNELETKKHRLEDLKGQNEIIQEKIEKIKSKIIDINNKKMKREREYKDLVKLLEKEETSAAELEELIRSDPTRNEQYNILILLNKELLRQKEKASKAMEQGTKLVTSSKREIQELENRLNIITSDDDGQKYEEEIKKYKELLKLLKDKLNNKDMEIIGLSRQIDGYPNRAELEQYEKRIDELIVEVAGKYEETKQTINEYNTKTQVVKTIENEEGVMTSIKELFSQVMDNNNNNNNKKKKIIQDREQLLEYCTEVREMLQGSKVALEGKLNNDKILLNEARVQYDELLSLQERHKVVISELGEAMKENISLRDRLAELEGKEEDNNNDNNNNENNNNIDENIENIE